MKRRVKIGFDLDGVLADKPPLVPKSLIEWLFKGGQRGLHYRYPDGKWEQLIRKISHFYLFRPPIKKNIAFLREIAQDKRFEIYLLSSRYSFLEKETQKWLEKRGLRSFFSEVILNKKDQKPHFFKAAQLKRLKLNAYFEDDPLIINFLRSRLKNCQVYWLNHLSEKEAILDFNNQYRK